MRPKPDEANVVLQFFDVATKKLRRAGVREIEVLGHQDPEWRRRREAAPVHAERPRRRREAPRSIMRYDTRDGQGASPDRGGLHAARRTRPTAATSRRPGRRRSGPTSSSSMPSNGQRAPAPHERRRLVGARLVAGRGRDRVPAHRRPDRRPAPRDARGDRPVVERRRGHRPDRGVRARRCLAARTGSSRPPSSRRRPRLPSRRAPASPSASPS